MTDLILVQPLKTDFSIISTFSGIVIVVSVEQFWKAPSPIVVTLSGIVIDLRAEQFLKAYCPMTVILSPRMYDSTFLPKMLDNLALLTIVGELMATEERLVQSSKV